MTNRQALMNWMDTLSNEEFIAQVLDRSSDLPERIDHALCLACKARHGGQCVLPPEDAECPIGTANWLDMDNNNAAGWSGSVDS